MLAGRAKLARLLERPRPGTRSHRLRPLVLLAMCLQRCCDELQLASWMKCATAAPSPLRPVSARMQATFLGLEEFTPAGCKYTSNTWHSRQRLIAALAAAPGAAPGGLPPSCSRGSLHGCPHRLAVPPLLLLLLLPLLQAQLRQPLPLPQPARLPLLRRRPAVPASAAAAPAADGGEPLPAFASPLAFPAACVAAAPFPRQPELQ